MGADGEVAVVTRSGLKCALMYGLIGLVVNVLVAWGFAAWGELSNVRPATSIGEHVPPTTVHVRGLTMSRLIESGNPYLAAVESDPWDTEYGTGTGVSATQEFRSFVVENKAVEFGWPLRSLWWYEIAIEEPQGLPPSPPHSQAWIEVPRFLGNGPTLFAEDRSARAGLNLPRRFPLLPLALGMIVNTAIYGLIAWSAALVGYASLQVCRRRRGLCPVCAYDLAGQLTTGCPECGRGRGEQAADRTP